jgi:hypothetical protein
MTRVFIDVSQINLEKSDELMLLCGALEATWQRTILIVLCQMVSRHFFCAVTKRLHNTSLFMDRQNKGGTLGSD